MSRTTDMPRGERLVRIFIHLIRNRTRKFTAGDIHDVLNNDEAVSQRNVQRDLKRLASMRESCVFAIRAGGKLLYGIEPDMRTKFAMPIADNELLALFLLKRLQPFFASRSDSLAAMQDALDELSSRLDEDLFEDLDQRLGDTMHVFDGRSRLTTGGRMLSDLLTALSERRVLEISYRRRYDKPPEHRAIRPVKLVLARGELFFMCISSRHDYWIKIARITAANLTDKQFTVPDTRLKRINKRLQASFGLLDNDMPTPRRVMLHFPASFDLILRERTFHHTQQVSQAPSGDMVLRMRVPVDTELVQWVLGWGDRVTVVAPDELKREVLRVGREFVRRYG